jgi:hypothetical protein
MCPVLRLSDKLILMTSQTRSCVYFTTLHLISSLYRINPGKVRSSVTEVIIHAYNWGLQTRNTAFGDPLCLEKHTVRRRIPVEYQCHTPCRQFRIESIAGDAFSVKGLVLERVRLPDLIF